MRGKEPSGLNAASVASIALLVLALMSQSCSLVTPTDSTSLPPPVKAPRETEEPQIVHTGHASWYGPQFEGKRTASGEIFNAEQFTAASRVLPLGSRARVTNLENGKSV